MFGKASDDAVKNQRGYNAINTACAGIKLSQSTIDAPLLRSLLHCFNAYGGLAPLEALTQKLSDDQLQPIIDTLNQQLLKNPEAMFQVEHTYYDLRNAQALDPVFQGFGKLLDNANFISSLLEIVREEYFGTGSHANDPDPDALKLIARVGNAFTPPHLEEGVDAGLTVATAKAFRSAQLHLRGASPSGRTLDDLTTRLSTWLRDNGDPHHVELGRELVNGFISGQLFSALDGTVGVQPNELRDGVAHVGSLFRAVMQGNSRILDGLTSLFHYLHVPITCLDGARTLPDADLDVMEALSGHALDDAGNFIRREHPLKAMALAGVCKFPKELGEYYPSLYALGDLSSAPDAARLLDAFYAVTAVSPSGEQIRPMANFLINLLADTGSNSQIYPGGPPENTVGIKRLLPIFSELSDRGAWEDIFLLEALLRVEDRPRFVDALRWLVDDVPELDNRSVYEVGVEAFTKTKASSLIAFARSFEAWIESDDPVAEPALRAMRKAYYVNDSHPFLTIAHNVLSSADANRPLFTTVLNLANMKEFNDSVQLFADMSKDGRLKDLTGALVALFHRFAAAGSSDIQATAEPAFVPKRRHDFAAADLPVFAVSGNAVAAYKPCSEINLDMALTDYSDATFGQQLDGFIGCVNADSSHAELAQGLDFLACRGGATCAKADDGRTGFDLVVDWLRDVPFDASQFSYLSNQYLKTFDDGRVHRAIQVVPMLTVAPAGSVIRPLFDVLATAVHQAGDAVKRLELYASTLLARQDLGEIYRYLRKITGLSPEPVNTPLPRDPALVARVSRWIMNKECTLISGASSPGQELSAEINRVFDDYDRERTTWDLVKGPDGKLTTRKAWTFDELKRLSEPLIQRLGDPSQSAPDRRVLDGMFNVVRYFSLPAGWRPNQYMQYPPEVLRRWMKERADDPQPINYFYPLDGENPAGGYEDTPQVKLANSLDRLEILIINADFMPPAPFDRNKAYDFLAQVGDAWGDEPYENWPPEIQQKYGRNGHPQTLAQAVKSIKQAMAAFATFIGYSTAPKCEEAADPNDSPDLQKWETTNPSSPGFFSWLPIPKKDTMRHRFFNLAQVLPILDEMIPHTRPDGTEEIGLKVLRDLFFEQYYSTPTQYRNSKEDCDKKWGPGVPGHDPDDFKENVCHNNLWVTMKIARLGMLHRLGSALRAVPADDASLRDFFEALVSVTRYPGVEQSGDYNEVKQLNPNLLRVLNALFVTKPGQDPSHPLLWAVAKQIFGVQDAAQYANGDASVTLDAAHRKELQGETPAQQAATKAQWIQESARLNQLVYYFIAMLKPVPIANPSLGSLGPVLEQFSDYLVSRADHVEDLLRAKSAAYFVRALYEDQDVAEQARLAGFISDAFSDPSRGIDEVTLLKDVDLDPASSNAWTQAKNRWDAVTASSAYQSLKLGDIADDILDFFDSPDEDPTASRTATSFRVWAQGHLARGDLSRLLQIAADHPDDFNHLVEGLGLSIQHGDLDSFLAELRNSLQAATPGQVAR